MQTRRVDNIIWREKLYPRFETFPGKVQEAPPKIPEIGHIIVGNRLHLTLGAATNGTCPNGLSKIYAGYIEQGNFHFVGSSVVKHFYFAYRDTLKNKTEINTSDQLAKRLKSRGWTIERESFTSQGRIDILAKKHEEERIIEVKLDNGSNSMSHALGQLLFYSKFHPGATLWVYTPEKPDLTILSILNSFNIKYLEED